MLTKPYAYFMRPHCGHTLEGRQSSFHCPNATSLEQVDETYKVQLYSKKVDGEISISKNPEPKDANSAVVGSLGWKFLKRCNFLLDVNHAVMILTNSHKKLKKDGYDLTKFAQIPFDCTSKGMVVNAEANMGPCETDGGYRVCTWTLVRPSFCPEGAKNKESPYPPFPHSHRKNL